MITVPLKCRCGAVRAQAEYAKKSDIKRYVCLCGDCQTFPQFLGNPEWVLDKNGGSEIIPTFPWNVRFTAGADELRCVRLSDDGIQRWYTECCKTPVGNILTSKLPYLGLSACFIDVADREQAFGPIRERVMGAHGIGELPPGTRKGTSGLFLLDVLGFIIKGKLSRKGRPAPFFGPDGRPTVKPLVLSDDEYIRLRARTGNPWRSK